jgi:hypothetical protein
MIIQLQGATAEKIDAARHSLEALASSWGQEITEAPAQTTKAAGTNHDDHDKIIDPFSLAALILSIPSAALAVLDLADRIRKRHRASELIGHAQQLAAQHVTLTLISQTRVVELSTLTPDQLLGLLDSEDPAS